MHTSAANSAKLPLLLLTDSGICKWLAIRLPPFLCRFAAELPLRLFILECCGCSTLFCEEYVGRCWKLLSGGCRMGYDWLGWIPGTELPTETPFILPGGVGRPPINQVSLDVLSLCLSCTMLTRC